MSYEMRIPVVTVTTQEDADGRIETVETVEVIDINTDDLTPDEIETAHMYLDTADYALRGSMPTPQRGPGGRGGLPTAHRQLGEFQGAMVGGHILVTDIGVLEDLNDQGDIDPAEDHSR